MTSAYHVIEGNGVGIVMVRAQGSRTISSKYSDRPIALEAHYYF